MLLAEEMLAALGYEPAGFTRPSDALDEFRADPSRFDVVVLDYLMPEMTGTELTKHLRAMRADIPIVLVSGYEGPVLLQEAFSAGIEHVITKPLALQQLAEDDGQRARADLHALRAGRRSGNRLAATPEYMPGGRRAQPATARRHYRP